MLSPPAVRAASAPELGTPSQESGAVSFLEASHLNRRPARLRGEHTDLPTRRAAVCRTRRANVEQRSDGSAWMD